MRERELEKVPGPFDVMIFEFQGWRKEGTARAHRRP